MCVRIGKVIQRIEDLTGGKSWRKLVREQGRIVEAHFLMTHAGTNSRGAITHIVWQRRK